MKKASGGSGIPTELFKILKDNAVKAANLENSAVTTGLEKVSFHSNPKEGQCQRMFKLLYSCTHFTLQQGNDKKSFKLGLNSMWIENFQMHKLDLEKAEEPENKLPTSTGSSKKQKSSRKTSISALSTMPKSLGRSQETVENSSRDGNTNPLYLPPEKSVHRSRSNSWNWTWKNQLVLNRERSTSRLYIVNLLI